MQAWCDDSTDGRMVYRLANSIGRGVSKQEKKMNSLTALPRTLELLIRCWMNAETEVRRLVTEKYTVHDEVFINRMFYGELCACLHAANERKEFSQAVLADLQHSTSTSDLRDAARRVTAGIVARVSYHEPHVEAVTGGDMGFTVVRPSFAVSANRKDFSSWLCEQGLLCQAKRQKPDGSWGTLTTKQKKILPGQFDYLALLLYGYSDSSRVALADFAWKSCAGRDLVSIDSWLKASGLDDIMRSPEVIDRLGNGRLGTNNEDVIRDVICAGDTAQLKVEVTWPDGPPPPDDPPPPLPLPWDHLATDLHRDRLAQLPRHEQRGGQQQGMQRHMVADRVNLKSGA
jgi:hypothetical protein